MGTRTLHFALAAVMTVLALAMPRAAIAFGDEDDIVNPWTAESPSGEYRLSVMPSQADGSGPATYTMMREGKVLWKTEHPFTLREGSVTDKGEVAGYAYSHGKHGRERRDESSTLNAIILNQLGMIRLNDARPRHHPPFMSNPPADYEPTAVGVIVDGAPDRLVIRTNESWKRRAWWVYRLSDGERVVDVDPYRPAQSEHSFIKELRCESIPDTPLVAIQWLDADLRRDSFSARFSVLTLDGIEIWTTPIANEWTAWEGEHNHWSHLMNAAIRQLWTERRGFSIASRITRQRTLFTVERDDGAPNGWRIESKASEPWTPTEWLEPSIESLRRVERVVVGTIELQTGADPRVDQLYGIADFTIDANGRIHALRHPGPDRPPSVVIIDGPDRIREVLLPDFAGGGINRGIVPIGGAESLVYRDADEEAPSLQSRIDGTAGAVIDANPLPASFRTIDAVLPDGSMIGRFGDNGITGNGVARVAAVTGRVLWQVPGGFLQDVALTSNQEVAVLEGVRNRIHFFSIKGQHLRSITLSDALGRDANYPSDLRPELDGGLILYDFEGDPSVILLSRDGKALSDFSPRHADGRRFGPIGGVQRAPDGRLWTSDGEAIYRLTNEGVVDLVIGGAPDQAPLTSIVALAVDRAGNILAQDERTGRVHVFNREGARVRVLDPDPGDYSHRVHSVRLAAIADGTVWAEQTWSENGSGFIRFAPDGTRQGIDRPIGSRGGEQWLGQPNSERRWIGDFSGEMSLIERDGTVALRLTHQPDGGRLSVRTNNTGVGPDGSLAAVSQRAIHLYACDGTPVASVPQWNHRARRNPNWLYSIATNGRWIATIEHEGLVVYDTAHPEAGPKLLFAPDPKAEKKFLYRHLAVSPDGKELWALRSDRLALDRFLFPD